MEGILLMKIKKHLMMIMLFLFLLSIFLMACDGDNTGTNANNDEQNQNNINNNDNDEETKVLEIDMSEPITLKINDWRGEEIFLEQFKEPIENEFPNVTIEHIPIAPYKSDLEEQFADGVVLDILHAPDFRYLPVYNEVELAYDISEFVETYQFNLDRYDQNLLDLVKSYSNDGELWGLPYTHSKATLHYNKEIFDKFGVDHPTDDMTYNEVIELAKLVTGERDDTYYTGMVMPSADRYLFPPLGLTLLDPVTDEPLYLEDPAFQTIFETYKEVHELQEDPDIGHGDDSYGRFISDQNLAMIPMYYLGLDFSGLLEATDAGMEWDIVTFPKWEEQEDVAGFADGHWLGVSAYSEYKPQVFKIIEFLLSDEEVLRKIYYPEESVYTDDQFFEVAKDLKDPRVEDKNLEALYKYPAPPAPKGRSKYEELAVSTVNNMLDDFLNSPTDVNTFLRELTEETTNRILEEKTVD